MSNTIVINLIDNVNLSIDCDISQAYEIKEFFSCYVQNYKYHPKYKARMWDGKISFFNVQDRTLPIGLMRFLKPFALKYDYKLRFTFDRSCLKNDITKDELLPFYDALYDGLKMYPRDYQQDAIYSAIRNKRGVLESATGSGKSMIIYSLIRFIMEDVPGKILLVVPSINLVNQMFDDCKTYGWTGSYDDISLLYGKSKNYDPNKKVLISTWQSIHKKPYSFFKQFGAVLVDECLDGNTLISMVDGSYKKISDIIIGDKILSYNTTTNSYEEDVVVNTFKNLKKSSNEKMYELLFDNGVIMKVTGNHKIYTKNRGYVRCDELTCDDDIVNDDNI